MRVAVKRRPELSAGGVVYRRRSQGVEVLLGEQSDRNTGEPTVRLPKGHVADGESLEHTAVREVLEETGRRASIREPLEEVSYRFLSRSEGVEVDKRVVFFLMEDAGPATTPRDTEMERVFWCPLAEADRRLSFEIERRVLRRAKRRLAQI